MGNRKDPIIKAWEIKIIFLLLLKENLRKSLEIEYPISISFLNVKYLNLSLNEAELLSNNMTFTESLYTLIQLLVLSSEIKTDFKIDKTINLFK